MSSCNVHRRKRRCEIVMKLRTFKKRESRRHHEIRMYRKKEIGRHDRFMQNIALTKELSVIVKRTEECIVNFIKPFLEVL